MVLLLAAFLISLWRPQMASLLWNLWLLSPAFPLCSLCLSIFPSCWAWKSPISFYSSHFGLFSPAWQAVRFTFSHKAVTHRRVSVFMKTLKCKKWQSVRELAKQGWCQMLRVTYSWKKNMAMRGWGYMVKDRQMRKNITACLLLKSNNKPREILFRVSSSFYIYSIFFCFSSSKS